MKKLNELTTDEVLTLIHGIYLTLDFMDGIDEEYRLSFKVEGYESHFKIVYNWRMGVEVTCNDPDPQYYRSKDVRNNNYFKILKSQSLQKFTKEVLDAIEEVRKVKYEEELRLIC